MKGKVFVIGLLILFFFICILTHLPKLSIDAWADEGQLALYGFGGLMIFILAFIIFLLYMSGQLKNNK